jgi:hypothetical protein
VVAVSGSEGEEEDTEPRCSAPISYVSRSTPLPLCLTSTIGQRVKARVQELEAKVHLLESGRQQGGSPPTNSQSSSQSSPG